MYKYQSAVPVTTRVCELENKKINNRFSMYIIDDRIDDKLSLEPCKKAENTLNFICRSLGHTEVP